MTKVGIKDYSVLTEVISPDNVQEMAELLTLKETKWLIGRLGEFASITRHNLYLDVMNKNARGYVLSDSYDLVQTVSVFLCEHFGEYLDDYYYSTKKGKEITLKFHCYHLVNRALCKKHSRAKSNLSLEALTRATQPKAEINIFEDTADYTAVDNIVSQLNLSELFATILNCRMSGMSFPEIGRIVDRCTSTVWSDLNAIRKRYIKLMQDYE